MTNCPGDKLLRCKWPDKVRKLFKKLPNGAIGFSNCSYFFNLVIPSPTVTRLMTSFVADKNGTSSSSLAAGQDSFMC